MLAFVKSVTNISIDCITQGTWLDCNDLVLVAHYYPEADPNSLLASNRVHPKTWLTDPTVAPILPVNSSTLP